jgi:ABC-2 type transport system ATP-binding protein
VRAIIRDLKARGTTVFLNSHLLGEVEATCDRVSFIKAGRVLRTLALAEMGAGQLHVELRVDAVTPALLAALDDLALERRFVDGEPGDAGVAPALDQGGAATAVAVAAATTLELTLADEELLPVIAERTLASGARLYALTPRRLSLEQLFLDVVGMEDSGQ